MGAEAVDGLKRYNFTKGFFGANGVHLTAGFTTPDITEALVKEKAMRQCKKVIYFLIRAKLVKYHQLRLAVLKQDRLLQQN